MACFTLLQEREQNVHAVFLCRKRERERKIKRKKEGYKERREKDGQYIHRDVGDEASGKLSPPPCKESVIGWIAQ